MKLRLLVYALLVNALGWGQVVLTNASPSNTIDFSNTMQASVGNGAFTGSGFQATPSVGRLNSNAWAVTGMSNGTLAFGGTQTTTNTDYTRGSIAVAVTTGGIYAYTGAPHSTTNPCLMIQPGADDFTPGTLTLRIRNDGSDYIIAMDVSYNLFIRNDQGRSNSFNFSYSDNNTTYTSVGALDYTSPEAESGTWTQVGTSPSRQTTITDLAIPPGGYFYIRWSGDDVGGSLSRDEFGLDDIAMTATYGIPSPPVITSDLNSSTLQDNPYSYFITGTYNPNNFNATGLPTGLSINTTTGEISGTPTVAGTYDITITATNPGGSDVQILQLVVFPPGPEINLRGATGGTQNIVSGSTIASALNNTLFEGQFIGDSQTKSFRIQNLGTVNLLLNGAPFVTIDGLHPGDFTITQPASGTISPGGFVDFQIEFSPLGAGIRTAIITILNNDGDEDPYTFLVQGNGKAPLIDVYGNGTLIANGSTIPSSTNFTFFGGVNVTASTTFYVTNNGGEDLILGPVTITGPNAADFSVSMPPAAIISGNNSSPMVITFTPSALGLRTAMVSITNNANSPYTFTISGVGIDFDKCEYGATEIIKTQDFEISPENPVWNYSTEQILGGNDLVTGGQAYGSSSSTTTNKYIGARSLQVNGPISNPGTGPQVNVVFETVNTSEYREVNLSFNLGAYATTSDQGLDLPDLVSVFISVDNGLTWSKELFIKGSNNSVWDINTASNSFTGVYKGNNIAYEISPPSTSTNLGFRNISITNIPAVSNLLVKFEIVVNRSDEIWVIDNVTLSGKYPLRAVWNGAWTPSAPSSTTKAIFEDSYDSEIDGGSITACSCEIQSEVTVVIHENDTFDIGCEVVNNGTLEIKNSGSLVQHYDYATNIGTIKMTRTTRNMYRWDYIYWGSPIQESLMSQIPNVLDKRYRWMPGVGANWYVLEVIEPGHGFITRVRNVHPFNNLAQLNRTISYTFQGTPNNGLVPVNVAWMDNFETNFENYNLLANPYPSAISAEEFLTQNSGAIDGTIYYWTSITPYSGIGSYSTGDYAKWNLTGGVGTNAPNDLAATPALKPDGQIVAGQGFFVRALANNALVNFRNSQRLITPNTQFFRTAQPEVAQESAVTKHRYWLNLTSTNGHFNQMLVGYLTGASNGIDSAYDGFSVVNNPVNLYSIVEGKSLSIQGKALPFETSDVVPLGLRITTAGTYTIAIDELDGLFAADQAIYIEDFITGVIHNLKTTPYIFTSASGTFESRFQIRYTNVTLGVDDLVVPSNTVWVYGTDVMTAVSSEELLASVVVHDLLGRRLYEAKNISAVQHVIGLKPAEQVLLVTITLGNGQVETRKVKF